MLHPHPAPGRVALPSLGAALAVGVLVVSLASGALGARPGRQAPSEGPSAVGLSLTAVPPAEASRSRTTVPVAPLRGFRTPDLLVTVPGRLTPEQGRALSRITSVTAVSVLATGVVQVGTGRLHAMAVEPSSFRGFTPRATAASDALWKSVAHGDLASSYAAKLPLGGTVSVPRLGGGQGRVGAIAAFGLPGSDLVVNTLLGNQLGMRPNSALIAAPDRRMRSLKRDVRALLGPHAVLEVLRPVAITYRRPHTYRELYVLSAQYCPGLSWKVLAAIGQVESGHGRNVGPSTAGALGPMQFLPTTWASAGVDGDGDGRADIMSPFDAVPAAALYLCRNGATRGSQGLYDAVFSYNHADWYVREVLALAAAYR